ncbi:uncharacterized protein [Panulirus ornatus]|uniref:uncharacterized protein n=1 Tax=Panulirus ornatus TaxID=150431 RepID=UPI003A89437F
MKVHVVLVSLVVAVSARMPFVLPDGADVFLKGRSLDTSFSCISRPYGYYADVDNDCAIFHICQPITSDAGQLVETAHFTFICGEGTIFSQSSLTCTTPDLAYSCSQAPDIYDSINALFGTIDEEFDPIIFPIDYRSNVAESVVVEAPVVESVEAQADIIPEVVHEAEAIPSEV